MTKETIKELKAALPTGWSRIIVARLAARTPPVQVTSRLVQYVVNGKSRNTAVEAEINILLDEAAEPDMFEETVKEKLKKLR